MDEKMKAFLVLEINRFFRRMSSILTTKYIIRGGHLFGHTYYANSKEIATLIEGEIEKTYGMDVDTASAILKENPCFLLTAVDGWAEQEFNQGWGRKG